MDKSLKEGGRGRQRRNRWRRGGDEVNIEKRRKEVKEKESGE